MTEHLDELAQLVDTAGADVVGRVSQQVVSPNPATLIGEGKVEELPGNRRRGRRDPGHLRRRAVPGAGRQPRARAQGAGDGPGRGHPRHLLDPGPEPRGQAAGRAGPARVPAAPAHPDVDPPFAHPRRYRPPGSRRNPARDRPPDHPAADPGPQGQAQGRGAAPGEPARGPRPDAERRAGGLHQRRQVQHPPRRSRASTRSSSRTGSSPRSTR